MYRFFSGRARQGKVRKSVCCGKEGPPREWTQLIFTVNLVYITCPFFSSVFSFFFFFFILPSSAVVPGLEWIGKKGNKVAD